MLKTKIINIQLPPPYCALFDEVEVCQTNLFRYSKVSYAYFKVNDVEKFLRWVEEFDFSGLFFSYGLENTKWQWGAIDYHLSAIDVIKKQVIQYLLLPSFKFSSHYLLRRRSTSSSRLIISPHPMLPIKFHGLLTTIKFILQKKGPGLFWDAIAEDISKKVDSSCDIIHLPVFILPFIDYTKTTYANIYLPHLSATDTFFKSSTVIFYNQEVLTNIYSISKHGWGRHARQKSNNTYFRNPPSISLVRSETKYSHLDTTDSCQANLEYDQCIVFLAQLPNDKSIRQNYHSNYDAALTEFKIIAENRKLTPMCKLHPLLKGRQNAHMRAVCAGQGIRIIDGEIKSVIEKFSFFCTVCSGSGVEVLSAGKHLISLGYPGYHDCSTFCRVGDKGPEYLYPMKNIEEYLDCLEVIA